MQVPWFEIFDNFGVKTVSATDKSRSAYVLNEAQLVAVVAAGMTPSPERPAPGFGITILLDPDIAQIEASYYHSARSDEAKRGPEPRMGHAFISSWAQTGDQIVIGNIGTKLFAAKVSQASVQQIGELFLKSRKSKRDAVIAKAKKVKGKPARVIRKQMDFVRNPHVVAAALIRADGKCELPACTSKLFRREDGSLFLEVHHVVPLAEDGVDELGNAAALCPMCHRELHFGKARLAKRRRLAAAVAAKRV